MWSWVQEHNVYKEYLLFIISLLTEGSDGKESMCNAGDMGLIPGLGSPGIPGKIPWRSEWHPTPEFLPREFHGQRSLAGYSPSRCKESDTALQPGGKNLPAKQVIQVQFLSWEDSLEEEMATHFSIVAWEIPWIEEPGWLQSKELWKSQKPLNDWITQPQPLLGALSLHMDQLLFHSIES